MKHKNYVLIVYLLNIQPLLQQYLFTEFLNKVRHKHLNNLNFQNEMKELYYYLTSLPSVQVLIISQIHSVSLMI